MIALGVVLLVLGYFFAIPVLWTLGLIAIVVGAAFWILGSTGRPMMGRRYWY